MERKKNTILRTLLMFLMVTGALAVAAQNASCFFYETYAGGNLEGWEEQIRQLEKQNPQTQEKLTEALIARYGYIGYLMGIRDNARARKVLDETDRLLGVYLQKKPGSAKLLSVKAGLTGLRIGLSPVRAPFLGPRNVEAWESAIKNDPQEPMGWLEKGNSLFYRPAMFGGDKKEAEAAFRRALQLAKPSECNWLYSFLQVRLYEACKANGNTREAELLRKNLQQKPGHFTWIDSL